MVKYRVFFGSLMTISFVGLVVLDGWMDGSLTASADDDRAIKATLLCTLIGLLVILAQLELAQLARAKNLKIFTPVSIPASVLFATGWYWPQLFAIRPQIYLVCLCAFSFLALLIYQYVRYRTSAVLANCGASCFSIIYLGLLSGFVPGMRIDFGFWPMLMFVCVIKSADIGAYAGGTLFGKHKFSPKVSPGKTWEGLACAQAAAMTVAILFGVICDIIVWWLAAIFGLCFAFIGQMGDLAESMMKRDAEQKDSANKVPGFGGILDIVDSPLVAAPFAYLFFMFTDGIATFRP